MEHIIVIGSGFGGLSIAIRLQAKGFHVTLFEKNTHVGGHAYPLQKKGYHFDMGPSLITAPLIIERIFNSAGVKLKDYIELIPLDPFYRIYFHDKSFLDYSGDSDFMKQQMARFNPKDAANYDRFMECSRQIHDAVILEGLGSKPFADWKTMMSFLPRGLKLNALIPSYSFAKKFFRDERHRFAFSFHPLFIGGNPFRAPAVYQMIPYLEKTGGVHFTKGGMYSLVKAFEKLFLNLGGSIKTDAPVSEIVVKDGRALGVIVQDELHEAGAVISNTDFHHTYHDLVKSEHRRHWKDRRLKKMAYSMSAFVLYLGIKRQYPKLKHHTLILSKRYKGLIHDIFDRKILPEDFSMYLHVPTRSDPNMAPAGCESMYVLVPVAHLGAKIDWEQEKERYAERILHFLQHEFGLEGLKENREVQEIFTPINFLQKNNNYLGSAWGVEPKLLQTAIFRPHNRSEEIERLYLVGASTHPGGGLPGVMLTAETTERVVLEDLGFPL